MTERRIVYRLLADVQPATRNPRQHLSLDEVKASIRAHGFVDAAIEDGRTGRIIAGHGRLEALLAMHAEGEDAPDGVTATDAGWLMPVQVGWSSTDDADAERLLVFLNRSVETGGWDDTELAALLTDMRGADGGLVGTGFTDDDLAAMVAELDRIKVREHDRAHAGDPDDIPPVPVEPVTRRGDVWLLGPHRVMCGDAFAGLPECDALISDPPYGMGLDTSWYGSTEVPSKFARLGSVEWDAEPFDPRPFASAAPAVALFGANYYPALLPERGTWWVWDKRTTSDGEGTIEYGGMPFELIWLNGSRAHRMVRYLWTGYYRQAGTPAAERHSDHPTQKPVAVMAEIIEYLTDPGSIVCDPFAGSGSTLIACHDTGRVARLIEIDPGYVDVICRRYEEHTGDKPILEATGEPHSFLPDQ